MLRAEETYRETKLGEAEDKDSISRALLSAGTALFIAACLKRAVVLFLVEQWRIWVFLVLNLILVAIFFTSNHGSYSESQIQEPKKQNIIKNREFKEPEKEENEIQQQEIEEQEEMEEEEEEIGLLNERFEAFIVMFKKQLISDARRMKKQRNSNEL